jgi:hypothetical protein
MDLVAAYHRPLAFFTWWENFYDIFLQNGPTDHLLWECELLRKQREVLKNSITKVGGNWPLTTSDLANKHTKLFQMFVNSINFETL